MTEYADKLRTLGFLQRKGTSNTTPVVCDDGRQGGTRTEHWDDHVDATVTRAEFVVNPNLKVRRDGDQG